MRPKRLPINAWRMASGELISICFTVRNRSRVAVEPGHVVNLFPNCIDSLLEAMTEIDHPFEIVVSDWNSTDWPLKEWLPERVGDVPLNIFQATGPFHHGTGRNLAAEAAKGNILMFIDADMLIASSFISKGLEALAGGEAYCPSCFYFINKEHSRGFWCDAGRGNCMMTRAHYVKGGKWPAPPGYTRPFDVDRTFFQRMVAKGITYVKERQPNFFHQYHPGRSVKLINRPHQQNLIRPTSVATTDIMA